MSWVWPCQKVEIIIALHFAFTFIRHEIGGKGSYGPNVSNWPATWRSLKSMASPTHNDNYGDSTPHTSAIQGSILQKQQQRYQLLLDGTAQDLPSNGEGRSYHIRSLTVNEALRYSPLSSIAPFNSSEPPDLHTLKQYCLQDLKLTCHG